MRFFKVTKTGKSSKIQVVKEEELRDERGEVAGLRCVFDKPVNVKYGEKLLVEFEGKKPH